MNTHKINNRRDEAAKVLGHYHDFYPKPSKEELGYMNYIRIYDEFITDRFNKQPSNHKYFERHHIVPKSLGGTNDKKNIIRLTASDHYFAHLCLAKIYGGNQWSSIICMTKMLISKNRSKETSLFAKRKMVSVAREKSAKHKSELYKGKLTRSKRPVFKIMHTDGRFAEGSIIELKEKTGISLASIYRLVNKLQGCTYCGWYFDIDLMNNAKQSKKNNGKINAIFVSGKNNKKIMCNETGVVYKSINEASKKTGICLSNYLHKNRTHAGGFTWSYL